MSVGCVTVDMDVCASLWAEIPFCGHHSPTVVDGAVHPEGQAPAIIGTPSPPGRAGPGGATQAPVPVHPAPVLLPREMRLRFLADVATALQQHTATGAAARAASGGADAAGTGSSRGWTAEGLDAQIEAIVVAGFGNPHCALVLKPREVADNYEGGTAVLPTAASGSHGASLPSLQDSFRPEGADDGALAAVGRAIEHLTGWFPNRTNVEFILPLGPDAAMSHNGGASCQEGAGMLDATSGGSSHGVQRARVRVWERGEGLTPACGSGACAAVVALHWHSRGRWSHVACALDGGTLQMAVAAAAEPPGRSANGHPALRVLMTGAAALVCSGSVDIR